MPDILHKFAELSDILFRDELVTALLKCFDTLRFSLMATGNG